MKKVFNNNITKIIIILLIVIMLGVFIILFSRDTSKINEIKDFIQTEDKILYFSDGNKKLINEFNNICDNYDLKCITVKIDDLSQNEKRKLKKIINTKNIDSSIYLYSNGQIVGYLSDYEKKEELIPFLQDFDILPQSIGSTDGIIDSIKVNLENNELTMLYLPLTVDNDAQISLLTSICSDYNIKFVSVNSNMLSREQLKEVYTLLDISDINNQIIILIKEGKIIGNVREISTKRYFYTDKLLELNIIEEALDKLNYIDINNYNNILNEAEKNIIVIGKQHCKYCEDIKTTLNQVATDYGVEINYLDIIEFNSDTAKIVEESLNNLGYNDGFSTPLTLIVENGKIIDYIIGSSKLDYFVEIFTSNGIIKEKKEDSLL